jgi:hypothetical protein
MVEHAGQLDIRTIDLPARDLVRRVEALDALAGDPPVLRVFERHVLRRL